MGGATESPTRGSRTPLFVGRARERALLRDRLAAALAGEGILVLVGGEAGIGKTALVRAVGHEAMAQGAIVLTGRCDDLIVTPPYGPWLDLAATYRPREGMPSLPAGLTDAEAIAAFGSPGALFAQVRDFLAAVAAARPAIVLLEDVHWADPASLDLLRFLARQLPALPLLLVVTYRADELARGQPFYEVLPALVREASAERIDLRPLGRSDLRELVAARYALGGDDEARLVAYLCDRSEGNPFFAHELLRTLEGEALLSPTDGGWVLSDLEWVPVPSLLAQVIDLRLSRLGDAAREALAIAAVIGQDVPLDLWCAVGGVPEDELLETVERAVAMHLLEATREGSWVRFVHALIREVLHAGVLPPRRRGWHRGIAEALIAAPAADPDAVAYHLQQAGDPRAEEWLIQAGERAQRTYAWLTAADRFEAALELMDARAAEARQRGWLLYRVACLRRFFAPHRGIAVLEEAARLAEVAGDPALAAHALCERGLLRCHAWDLRRGVAEMAAGVAALDALPGTEWTSDVGQVDLWAADTLPAVDSAWLTGGVGSDGPHRVHRRGMLVEWLALAGRLDEARTLGEQMVASDAKVGRRLEDPSVEAYFGLGQVYADLGRPEEARRAFGKARALFLSSGHHAAVAIVALRELFWGVLPYQADDVPERQHLATEAEAAWSRASGAGARAIPLGMRLSLMLVDGKWSEARSLALEVDVSGGRPPWELPLLAREQRDIDLARRLLRRWLPGGTAAEPGGSEFLMALALQRMAALMAVDAGDLAMARTWLEAHDRWLAWSGAVLGRVEGHLAWGAYRRAAGDAGLARRHADEALAHATEPRQPLALLAAHRFLGELDTDAGRHADAARHFDQALALADACAAPYERALTVLALAQLHAATGQTSESLDLAGEVRAACIPLGATLALSRADALSARLLSAPAPATVALHGFSPREVQVLRLLAEGRTDREIAETLFVSPRTVSKHVATILAKLEAPSRAAAAAHAVRRGLV